MTLESKTETTQNDPRHSTERQCPECNGTGSAKVKQPTRPGVRIYPARCNGCLGKGKVAN